MLCCRFPGRRVGKCLLDANQLHDWSLAGCTSKGSSGGDAECSFDHVSCAGYGPAYSAARCNPANDTCATDYGTCGNVYPACNSTGYCVVPAGSRPGPICKSQTSRGNGTVTALSFDAQDPSCLDIYTNSATEYEGAAILFFPSAYRHMTLRAPPSQEYNNDGLVDVRFGTSRSVLDSTIRYPPTRNGRAPFVPLGVNLCKQLVQSVPSDGTPLLDWCYNSAPQLAGTSVDTGVVYMATGYSVSSDGSQLNFYSGGEPATHGGGAPPGKLGSIIHHSAVSRHTIRRDGFVSVLGNLL